MDRRGFLASLASVAAGARRAGPMSGARQGNPTKITVLIGTAPPDPASLFFYYGARQWLLPRGTGSTSIFVR